MKSSLSQIGDNRNFLYAFKFQMFSCELLSDEIVIEHHDGANLI